MNPTGFREIVTSQPGRLDAEVALAVAQTSAKLAEQLGGCRLAGARLVRMPGLPRRPRAESIDVRNGAIVGLS